MTPTLLSTRALGRNFGHRTALIDVNLEVGRGEIVALVGPNGSGKTTLLKLAAGLLRPSAGSLEVLGRDPARERVEILRRARFALAPPPLYEGLTGREHMQRLGSLVAPVAGGEVDGLLERVGLGGRGDDRVRTYSMGMKQRLHVALALLPMPELLVLDEPTDGLDPLAVLELREILQEVRRERGVTVVLSSHLMVEVDRLVDRMIVLQEGRVLFQGTPRELTGEENLRLVVSDVEATVRLLEPHGLKPRTVEHGIVDLLAGDSKLAHIQELLQRGGVELQQFSRRRPTLDEALLQRYRNGST